MTTNDMIAEIREANLRYLMLAQQMIRSDKAAAIFRLGISGEIADLLEGRDAGGRVDGQAQGVMAHAAGSSRSSHTRS